MEIIDEKFEKLKDSVYKLGIQPIQFRNMVEGQALFEWSPEVALALSTRFCSWVVAEEDAEHNLEESEESKSLLLGGRARSRVGSQMMLKDGKSRNGSIMNLERNNSSSGNMQTSNEE